MSVEERVAAGAAWLDTVHPGWERKIDLAAFDIEDSCRCVLGQVCGTANFLPGYTAVLCVINAGVGRFGGIAWMGHRGFAALKTGAEFPALDEAWIALIKERFSSGTLSDEG